MKKFLTFVLCFCIVFAMNVGVSFAAVANTSYKSEVVKNAVESVCTVDMTKYSKSMESTIEEMKTELRQYCYSATELNADIQKKIDTFKEYLAANTVAKQETELAAIKSDAIIKFTNKLDAYVASKTWTEEQIKLGEKSDFKADVKAFSDWFKTKRFYHPNRNVINAGHEVGSTELTFTKAKEDIAYLNTKTIDDTWFNSIVSMLDEVKNLKYEADKYYADFAHYNSTNYSTTAIATAKTATYADIELLDITDSTGFVAPKTIAEEKAEQAENDAKALSDAKAAAILAITSGNYYIGNWSGEAQAYVKDIQTAYTGYINAATTIAKVDTYKYEAMTKIGAYKSDVQIKNENDQLTSDLENTKDELEDVKAELEAIKKEQTLIAAIDKLEIKVRSSKTSKGYIKVKAVADTEEIEKLGYTVEYKFYRATSKNGKYTYKFTSDNTYTNTSGTKGKTYYYRVKIVVSDEEGNIITQSNLKDCKYACRKFGK